MFKVVIHKDAIKDLEKLKQAKLGEKAKQLVEDLKIDPYNSPVEKLKGINVLGKYLICLYFNPKKEKKREMEN